MAYENLLKSVEESAQEKERILREKTSQQIKDVLDEARARADAVERELVGAAVKKVSVEKNKETYLAGAEIKLRAIQLKETYLTRAFLEAQKKVAGIRDDPMYPAVFKKLAEESLGALESHGVRIHIDKRDENLCRTVIGPLAPEAEILTDLKCAGGLIITSHEGNLVISNTIESRLERARERLTLELYRTLAGD
jgi:V/A-type H+/Na+-transporting ATPase subunit E